MNLKARAGAAIGVVCVGLLVAWPGVSGLIAETVISGRLQRLAEQNDYEVVDLNYTRGFGDSELSVRFLGRGMRALNKEVVDLTGVIAHGSALELPNLFTMEGNMRITRGEGELAASFGGAVEGALTVTGHVSGRMGMDPVVFPVDGETGMVAAMDSYTITYDSGSNDKGRQLFQVSPVTVRVEKAGRQSFQIESAPSVMSWHQSDNRWSVTVPQLNLLIDGRELPVATISDLDASGHESEENGVIASAMNLSTGSVDVDGREDPVLKAMSMRSSLENVSLGGVSDLVEAAREGEAAGKEVMSAVYSILDAQPRYSLDELSLDTGKGTMSVNFSLTAKEGAGQIWRELVEQPGADALADQLRLLGSFESETGIQLDDALVTWGCRETAVMQVSNPLQVDMVAGACGELIKKGRFLGINCRDASCQMKMADVQKEWQKSLSLDARFDGQNVTLNNVEFGLLEFLELL